MSREEARIGVEGARGTGQRGLRTILRASVHAIGKNVAEKLRAMGERGRMRMNQDICTRANVVAVWRNY